MTVALTLPQTFVIALGLVVLLLLVIDDPNE